MSYRMTVILSDEHKELLDAARGGTPISTWVRVCAIKKAMWMREKYGSGQRPSKPGVYGRGDVARGSSGGSGPPASRIEDRGDGTYLDYEDGQG